MQRSHVYRIEKLCRILNLHFEDRSFDKEVLSFIS